MTRAARRPAWDRRPPPAPGREHGGPDRNFATRRASSSVRRADRRQRARGGRRPRDGLVGSRRRRTAEPADGVGDGRRAGGTTAITNATAAAAAAAQPAPGRRRQPAPGRPARRGVSARVQTGNGRPPAGRRLGDVQPAANSRNSSTNGSAIGHLLPGPGVGETARSFTRHSACARLTVPWEVEHGGGLRLRSGPEVPADNDVRSPPATSRSPRPGAAAIAARGPTGSGSAGGIGTAAAAAPGRRAAFGTGAGCACSLPTIASSHGGTPSQPGSGRAG